MRRIEYFRDFTGYGGYSSGGVSIWFTMPRFIWLENEVDI